MRKQYHFRPGPGGLRAWDIDRLIDLAGGLPRGTIPLSAIRELNEPYWSSGYDRPLTCRDIIEHFRLTEATDLTYPIILSMDGGVMDGMHRVAKAVLLGFNYIDAVRFSADPEPDYVGVHPDNLPY